MRFLVSLGLCSLLLSCLVGPGALQAQPIPLGLEFQVNNTTALNQQDPQIAKDSDGDFVVVWTDGDYTTGGLDGSSFGIVGQRFDSDGNPVGSEFVVNTDTLGDQSEPAVAMDPDGNFVVVWTDGSNFGGDGDGSSNGISGQLYDDTGSPVGTQFRVNSDTANQQTRADVAMDANGNFVVAFGTFQPSGSTSDADLFARRFDSSANPLGSEFQVNTYTLDRQYRSELGFDAAGNFVIAWRSAVDGDEDYDIIARRYDGAGNPLTGEIQVNSYTFEEQRDVSLAVAPDGSFVAAWSSDDFDGSSRGIAARRFDATGTPIGNDFQVNTYTTSSQANPDIAMDTNGNFVVTWASFRQDGDGRGVFAQQFDSSGNAIGGEFQVTTTTAGDQGYGFRGPDVAMDDSGNFTVTWEDDGGFTSGGTLPGADGDGAGVFAQRFDANYPDFTLIGHWPLDEGAGTTTADTSINGLDGTLEGGVDWVPGQQATGTSFNGSDALIRVPDSGASSPIDVVDALTIALWVLPEGTTGSHQVLVSKDNSYELEFGKLGATTWDLRLRNEAARVAATPLEQGVWQHLAMTWDGSQVCSYYNGLLDGCSPFGGTLTPNDDDLGFGARPTSALFGGPVFHFAGSLDEVYVYNRAFTDTEIADLVLDELTDVFPPNRSNPAPAASLPLGTTLATLGVDTNEAADCRYDTVADRPFSLMANLFTTTGGTNHATDVAVVDGGIYTFYVRCRDAVGNTNGNDVVISFGIGDVDLCNALAADWRLDEGSGCTLGDETAANGAVLGPNCPTNAPTWVAGRTGSNSALAYDGNDDEVRIASPSGLSPLSSVTLAAWIRHDPAGNWRSIIDRRDSGNDGYDIYVRPNSRLFMRANNATLTGNAIVADGQWHHVVGVYDGSEIQLYVDGQLDAAGAANAGTLDVTAPLFLGRHWQNTQNAFAGTLDEATVHGRALSAVEVLDLFNSGIPVCP